MSDTDRGFISTSAIVGRQHQPGAPAPASRSRPRAATRSPSPVRRRRARGGGLVRVAQPRRALGRCRSLRLREQQRGRARLGGRRLPDLRLRGRRPDRHPEDVRDPGRDGRRRATSTLSSTSSNARRAHARAQGAVLHPRADRALAGTPAALARRSPTGETDISMAWDDSGISGEHEQWFREHDPVLRYARQLLASGDIEPGRADRAGRAHARADRRGAPVRPRQPAAHAGKRTRPRLRLRRRPPWQPRTTPTRCWTSSRRSWRRTPTSSSWATRCWGSAPRRMQFAPFQEQYGDRIYFPPCSEAAYSALAAGAAMCGQRMFLHLGLAPFTYPAFSTIASEVVDGAPGSGGRVVGPRDLPHEPRAAARRRVAAQREPDGDVLERAGHRDRRALGPGRPQGPADDGAQERQPDARDHPRLRLRRRGRRAGRRLRDPARPGRREARGLRRDDRAPAR